MNTELLLLIAAIICLRLIVVLRMRWPTASDENVMYWKAFVFEFGAALLGWVLGSWLSNHVGLERNDRLTQGIITWVSAMFFVGIAKWWSVQRGWR